MDSCQKLLERGGAVADMLKYAQGLHANLQTFSDSVHGVMQHLSVSLAL